MRRVLFAALLCLLSAGALAQKPPINAVAGPTTSAALEQIISDATGSGPLNFGNNGILNIQNVSGIDCTGVADSSSAFQAAVNANPVIFIPRGCTVTLNSIALPSTITIFGTGDASVIKHRNSATGHLFTQSNAGAYTYFTGLTIDGNYLNNGGDTSPTLVSIRWLAAGASASQPAKGIIRNVTFINGDYADVSAIYSDPAFPFIYQESDTRHLGGADSGFYGIFDQTQASLTNVYMDPLRLPTTATTVGKGGYAFFKAAATDVSRGSLTATNIQCYRTGTASVAGIIGCLDDYQGGDSVTISNSFSKQAIGRGFTWKGDAANISINNVVVTDLASNPANPSGTTIGQCIAGNPGSVDTTTGRNWQFSNLTCRNTAGAGILLNMRNGDQSAVGTNAIVSNVLVDTCTGGSSFYALDIGDANAVQVRGALITGCTFGFRVREFASPVTGTGPLRIEGVQTIGANAPTFDSGAKAAGLWVARNNFASPIATADLTLTVTTNAVTAWTPVALIDTSGANQTVSTINNVPDGETITVYASSASNILTLGTGGNLNLQVPIAIKDTTSSVTFKSINGSLFPIAADTQSLLAFKQASTALSIRPFDGTAANGNVRGANAVDLQAPGNIANQVSSGTNSFSAGAFNVASGINATVLGQLNIGSGTSGLVSGIRADDKGRYACRVHSASRFVVNGDQQISDCLLSLRSTATTPSQRLTSDQAAPGSANIVNLANNTHMLFSVRLTVRDSVSGDKVDYIGLTNDGTEKVSLCAISRGANAAATAMDATCTMTALYAPAGTLAGLTAPVVTADTTNGGFSVAVTPVGTNATDWVAHVTPLEVQ